MNSLQLSILLLFCSSQYFFTSIVQVMLFKELVESFHPVFPHNQRAHLFSKAVRQWTVKKKCGSCGGDRMTNKYEQRLLEAFSFAFTKSLSSSMKFLGLLVQCCQAYSLNSLEQTALMTVKSVMEVHLR